MRGGSESSGSQQVVVLLRQDTPPARLSRHGVEAWISSADLCALVDSQDVLGRCDDVFHVLARVPRRWVRRLWALGRGRLETGEPLLAPDGRMILAKLVRRGLLAGAVMLGGAAAASASLTDGAPQHPGGPGVIFTDKYSRYIPTTGYQPPDGFVARREGVAWHTTRLPRENLHIIHAHPKELDKATKPKTPKSEGSLLGVVLPREFERPSDDARVQTIRTVQQALGDSLRQKIASDGQSTFRIMRYATTLRQEMILKPEAIVPWWLPLDVASSFGVSLGSALDEYEGFTTKFNEQYEHLINSAAAHREILVKSALEIVERQTQRLVGQKALGTFGSAVGGSTILGTIVKVALNAALTRANAPPAMKAAVNLGANFLPLTSAYYEQLPLAPYNSGDTYLDIYEAFQIRAAGSPAVPSAPAKLAANVLGGSLPAKAAMLTAGTAGLLYVTYNLWGAEAYEKCDQMSNDTAVLLQHLDRLRSQGKTIQTSDDIKRALNSRNSKLARELLAKPMQATVSSLCVGVADCLLALFEITRSRGVLLANGATDLRPPGVLSPEVTRLLAVEIVQRENKNEVDAKRTDAMLEDWKSKLSATHPDLRALVKSYYNGGSGDEEVRFTLLKKLTREDIREDRVAEVAVLLWTSSLGKFIRDERGSLNNLAQYYATICNLQLQACENLKQGIADVLNKTPVAPSEGAPSNGTTPSGGAPSNGIDWRFLSGLVFTALTAAAGSYRVSTGDVRFDNLVATVSATTGAARLACETMITSSVTTQIQKAAQAVRVATEKNGKGQWLNVIARYIGTRLSELESVMGDELDGEGCPTVVGDGCRISYYENMTFWVQVLYRLKFKPSKTASETASGFCLPNEKLQALVGAYPDAFKNLKYFRRECVESMFRSQCQSRKMLSGVPRLALENGARLTVDDVGRLLPKSRHKASPAFAQMVTEIINDGNKVAGLCARRLDDLAEMMAVEVDLSRDDRKKTIASVVKAACLLPGLGIDLTSLLGIEAIVRSLQTQLLLAINGTKSPGRREAIEEK